MVQPKYNMGPESVKEAFWRKYYLTWELNGVLRFQPTAIGKSVLHERRKASQP